MGLHNTAHYLKSKGREDDTELVHMTKGEVQALKGIARAHGGEITINPDTGLPEAGFLSNILPTVAGIAVGVATENPYLGAAVAGMGKYAQSGSITQGLMAGMAAYGGADLAGGIGEVGVEAGTEAAAAQQAAALEGTTAGFDTATYSNLTPEQLTGYKEAFANAPDVATQKGILQSAAQANAALGPHAGSAYSMSNIGTGLKALGTNPGAMGSFAANNITNLGMFAAPMLVSGQNKSTIPTASSGTGSNPFGMKTIPTDASGKPIFNPTLPAQPTPAYVARYPNYVKNPYNPYATTPTPTAPVYAAEGGLMQGGTANVDFMGGDMFPQSQIQRSYYSTPTQAPTSAQQALASYEPKTNPLTGQPTANMASGGIASYSGKYGSVVGINQATKDLEEIYGHRTPMSVERADTGIYQDTDPNTRNLDAYSRALYIANAKAKAAGMKKDAISLPKPMLKLGDIEEDAEGGVVGMADGGDTSQVYKPSYANYAQTPFDMASAPAYGGIPIPTRSPMGSGTTAGSAGYAIDPATMAGSPVYNDLQTQLLSAQQELYGAEFPQIDTKNTYGVDLRSQLKSYQDQLAQRKAAASTGEYAGGGAIPSLGGYAAGGNPRLLKGPGDGMSDSIPANIGGRQPARLADGEFVVPADVVSHLGNGSTDAGAKKLYSMMDNIRRARTGRKKQAPAVKADKYIPK